MRTSSRIALAIAALALLAIYLVPLWRIDLHAPQYPEGLGLRIWVNQITGLKPNDLNSINMLNHYIGMHEISPDDIPELRLMPWLLGGLVGLGLLVAAVGRRVFSSAGCCCSASERWPDWWTSGCGATATATSSTSTRPSRSPG